MYTIQELQSIIQGIAEPLALRRVILVGSYAKATATDTSDIDLVIDAEDLSESYWDFLFRVEDALRVEVDVMTARGLRGSCLKDNVLEGGITLYEA